jgi:EPS-associated MarR family transcriptional regulator
MSVGEEIILRLSSGPRNRLASIGFDVRSGLEALAELLVEFRVQRMNANPSTPDATPVDALSSGHLELLRLLEQHPDYSQRQLSTALGISLGKTHYLLKALLTKGWVKAKNFQRSDKKLRYLYVLTPTGVRHRVELTQSFLARKEQEYESLKAEILQLRNEVAARAGDSGS